MGSKVYGYVRVSSQDQNEDRQMIAMDQAGVPRENIKVIYCISSVSTAWGVTMRKSRISGGSSRKRKKWILL